MKFSSNTRYAIRLLFELQGMRQPVSVAFLSEKTGIALRTLENIHAVLRRNGLTNSAVGARGGISLAVSLETISLGHIAAIFDDSVELSVCCGEKANECQEQQRCTIRAVWGVVSSRVQTELDTIFLNQILNEYPTDDAGVRLNTLRPRGQTSRG